MVHAQTGVSIPDSLERARAVDYFYIQSRNCLEQGEFDKYHDLLEHCHALDPESCAIMYDLASVYGYMGKDSLAHEYLTRIVAKEPANQHYNRALMNFYAATGDKAAAIKVCEGMLETSASKSDIYITLYSLYTELGCHVKAIEALDKLEKLEGRSEDISINKLKQYMLLQDSTRAVEVVMQLIEENPDDLRFVTLLGDTYGFFGNYEAALDRYNAALAISPDDTYSLMSLSSFYSGGGNDSLYSEYTERLLKSGGLDAATRTNALVEYINYKMPIDSVRAGEFLKEMSLLPSDELEIAEVYVQYLMFINERQEVIIPQLEKILSIDPERRSAMLQLLGFAIDRNDNVAVLKYADNALMYIPEMLELYFYKGLSQYLLGEKDKAIETYKTGLERRGEDASREMVATIYSMLGDAYHEKSMMEECVLAYDSALVYNPDDLGVLNNYAYYMTLEGWELQRALEMSHKTIVAEPENPTYIDTYAWALFALGRYEEAKAYIDKLFMIDEERDAVVYHHAGDIYARCGEMDRAVEFWQKAVEKGDESKLLKKKIKKRKYYKAR